MQTPGISFLYCNESPQRFNVSLTLYFDSINLCFVRIEHDRQEPVNLLTCFHILLSRETYFRSSDNICVCLGDGACLPLLWPRATTHNNVFITQLINGESSCKHMPNYSVVKDSRFKQKSMVLRHGSPHGKSSNGREPAYEILKQVLVNRIKSRRYTPVNTQLLEVRRQYCF